MMLTIPYQTLEIPNIHINPFKNDNKGRAIAPLVYKDCSVDINDVNLLTPPLVVENYDPTSCRMTLSIRDMRSFSKKMQLLQEFLINTFFVHRYTLLGHNATIDEIRQQFQMLATPDILTIFVYPNIELKNMRGETQTVASITPGDVIRCNVKLQGIVFGTRGGRLRIQHSVSNVWRVEE